MNPMFPSTIPSIQSSDEPARPIDPKVLAAYGMALHGEFVLRFCDCGKGSAPAELHDIKCIFRQQMALIEMEAGAAALRLREADPGPAERLRDAMERRLCFALCDCRDGSNRNFAYPSLHQKKCAFRAAIVAIKNRVWKGVQHGAA